MGEEMDPHVNYFPVTPGWFSTLAVALAVLAALIYFRVLRFVYARLGLSSRTVIFLLFASLLGSYINIPIAHLPEQTVVVKREFSEFGFRFVTPMVVDWPGSLVAVNVGGALIPVMLSFYLLARRRIWGAALLATAGVALICHMMAYSVPGAGIAMPLLAPTLATVVIARIMSLENMAPLAYVSGSLGALIGADLLNLSSANTLGAPIISIGGAGTFDAVFLTGVVSVALAGFMDGAPARPRPQPQRGPDASDRSGEEL